MHVDRVQGYKPPATAKLIFKSGGMLNFEFINMFIKFQSK